MPVNVTLQGADYPDVPSVILPKTGGGNANFYHDLKLGVIRPDAELVQTWTYDKKIHADEGVTIPAYTTTDTTLRNWQALTPTYSADRDNYDYFAQCRGLAIPIYNSSAVAAGRCEYTFSCMEQEFVIIPANSAKAIVDNTKSNNAWQVSLARQNSFNRNLYWSSASALAIDFQNYGPYLSFSVDVAMGGATITARAPLLKIRGNTTYFNSTYWGYMTDIRYQFVIELYRVPRGSLNFDGWNTKSQLMHCIDCANSSSHTLT